MAEEEVKIWKMNDCDWVAARNLEEAKKCLADLVNGGKQDEEFEGVFLDDPEPITDADMDRLKFLDEDLRESISFRERLKNELATGEKVPFFFASTEV